MAPSSGTVDVGLVHQEPAVRRQLEALLGPHAGVRVRFSVAEAYDALGRLGTRPVSVLFAQAAQVIGPGAGFIRLARERDPACRIMLLTAGESDAELLELLRCGAMGFVDPRARPDLLAKAAHALHIGEAWVPRRYVACLIEWLGAQAGAKSGPTPIRA